MSSDLNVPTANIRNVLLIGQGGTGKTSIAEAMLHVAGLTGRPGSSDDGTSALDFEPEEQDRRHSLGLALAAIPWRGHKINVLDSPGSAEAVGDAYAALRATDVAIFAVDATAGVQPVHQELWEACTSIDLPRIVVLNKLDKENAAFQRNIDQLAEAYGRPFAPVHMPIGVEHDFHGIIDLLHSNAIEIVDGKRIEEDIPEERAEQAQRNREVLIEAIVENDDDLLERYLEGEIPESKELAAVFAKGIASCGFFPLLCASATKLIGIQMLMDFIVEECPSPSDGQHAETIAGPTALYTAKTLSDPYVGRINIFRVVGAGFEPDATVTNTRTGKDARLHQPFTLQGKEQLPLGKVAAGDMFALSKLEEVVTGDVLVPNGASVEVEMVLPPEAYFQVAVNPASAGDDDKLSTALQRISEEDVSLRITRDDTGAMILSAYGPTHVDVVTKRLHRKFGVEMVQSPPPISYRETLVRKGKGVGKHVKQSGGHGQYGIAHMEVEPLPRGSGIVFEDKIVGGVIPHQFIPSVEKGLRQAVAKGPLGGFPVVDVKATVVDGKHHSVDSSDAAFQMAGVLAFKAACEDAGMKILEPIMQVDISVPDDLTGAVMGDLSSRRGRILGTDPAGPGRQMVHAQVPQAELLTYAAELRALTSAHGRLAIDYDHHEDVPSNVAQKIIEQAHTDGH